jgi:nucleoside-diphosphate-sugar epimerase
MKKVLITGNLGYVGSVLTAYIKSKSNKIFINGCDLDFFSKDYESNFRNVVLDTVDNQIYKDIGELKKIDFYNIHTVIHLAAVSNDPIGNEFLKETKKTNFQNTKKIIFLAKNSGVKHFIFASSCSVYGFQKNICIEKTKTKPLTNYSKSKVYAEKILKSLANKNFKVTILRFATACGHSPFIRLDLVLNDFVASAVYKKKIMLLSSGDAIRPLISVNKMSRIIFWFLNNFSSKRKNFLLFNAGSSNMNFAVKNIAKRVKKNFKGIFISVNKDNIDNRSYKVDFSKLEKYLKNKIKEESFTDIINSVRKRILLLKKVGSDFRQSRYIRLNKIRKIINN